MYNQSSFSCRIIKFQLRLFRFVFVLQVNVGPLAVVSCDTQKTNTVNCCAWLTKRHKGKRKAKEYSMNMRLHENSVRLWNASKVFVYKYINIKNNGLLNSFCTSILLQLESSSFWEFWVLSRWQNTHIQALHIQYPVHFRHFDIVQTSLSRGQHLCSKFAKIPHLGCPRTFKVPTSSCGPPPPRA